MSLMTKVLIVLTAVFSIALSTFFVAAAAQWNNWRGLSAEYARQRDAAIVERDNAQAMAQSALAMKDDLLSQQGLALQDARNQIQRISDELAAVRAEAAQIRSQFAAAEAGRTKLQETLSVTLGELNNVREQHQTVMNDNLDLQTRNGRLNERVLELTMNVTTLTDETRNIREKLYACEQGGARASRSPAGTPPGVAAVQPTVSGPIRARVTEVAGKYASISAGENSGVSEGMTFIVYRDSEYLGDLVIDKVEPTEAGGKLDSLAEGRVQSGDLVVFGLN